MPLVVAQPGSYGLPSQAPAYAAMIRATPGLVTYWPGTTDLTTSVANYSMPSVFSMECWTYITSVASNHGVLSNWNGGNGSMIWVDASNTRFTMHVNGSDIDSGITPSANTWYHLVATYDGTSRQLFVNGTLLAGPTSGVTPAASSTPLTTHHYAGDGGSLTGLVADAAIYSRLLNANEVSLHFAGGRR